MNRILFAFLLILAVFQACRKDFDITTNHQLGPIPTVNVEASLTGLVTNGYEPIPDATVEVAGLTLTTNSQGLFFVNQKLMDKNGTYIKVHKEGYFDGARFAYPRLGSNAFVEVKMLYKNPNYTFVATGGATINYGTININIPANAIATQDGQAYTGNVSVSLAYISPEYDLDYMPGDLRAIDTAGYAKILKTYGMVGVELESPTGEKLNLLPGKKATISMEIPSSLQSGAPATIPLWHFDESNGYWREEGSAALNGTKYVGEVGHFSFWNCDVPFDFVLLSGKVKDNQGTPLANIGVILKSQILGSGGVFTDNEGNFGGLVPKNEVLEMRLTYNCGGNEPLYKENIGPFSNGIDLGEIKVTLPTPITISGKLLDCSGNPLSNGLVFLQSRDTLWLKSAILSDENGGFSVTFNHCSPSTRVQLNALDIGNLTQNVPIDFMVNNTNIDVGHIPVCSALDEYIKINLDGKTQDYFFPNFYYQNGEGFIMGMILGSGISSDTANITLAFDGFSNNISNIVYINGRISDNGNYDYLGCSYCANCNCNESDTDKLIFSQFPSSIGEYAVGSCSGKTRNSLGFLVPYSLEFRVKKKF